MAGTFPTLTGNKPLNPAVTDHTDQISFNPTIRSPKDAGYQQTRPRFTRYPRVFHIVYNGITTANKDLIRAHEEDRGVGGSSFTWTNPADSISYTVRFLDRVKYRTWEQTNYTRWVVTFDLEEI